LTTPAVAAVHRGVRDQLGAEYAGPGMWGECYRSPGRRRWYRLIPVAELGADQRSQLLGWRSRPQRRGIVPVIDDGQGDQRQFGEQWFQVVCYETGAAQSLADVIAGPDPRTRLSIMSGVLRAIPHWWDCTGPGLVPLPADIVLADGQPDLLPLPSWGPPSIAQLLAEPARIAHLAPETVRGIRPPGRAEDLFSFAVMASRCLAGPPGGDAERMLHRAACGTMYPARRGDSRLPFWMRRVAPIRAAWDRLAELTGAGSPAREHTDPDALAVLLERACAAMNPLAAMRAARDDGDPRQAVDLAYAVLVDDPGYDILLLAAQIADQDLDAPLEALSFLDRAVHEDADRADARAYAAQLSIIGAATDALPRELAPDVADRLDRTAGTAFGKLPPGQRREHAHDFVSYLILRGRLREANAEAHRWLHDDTGTLMWWKFDLMLDYAQTFAELGHDAQALTLVAEIKKGMRLVRDNGQMTQAGIHGSGMRLARLEQWLHQNPPGGTAP
jgi:hypothetical protein